MSGIPEFLSALYPFESHYLRLPVQVSSAGLGYSIHYIDEGKGRPLLMVHGNPSWSFLYRNLILGLSSHYRCIAVDHMGCGLSDKPQDYPYTLAQHIQNLKSLIDHLGLQEFDLVVHDWGGVIGLKIAQIYAQRVKTILILNTSAFLSRRLPWQIALCRLPYLGPFLVQGLNVFARGATYQGVGKPLTKGVRAGFCYPYSNWKNRIAIRRFIEAIPLDSTLESYSIVEQVDKDLGLLSHLNLHLLWGMKDFCFTPDFLEGFQQRLPKAKVHPFSQAGHYVLEDAEALQKAVAVFKEALA